MFTLIFMNLSMYAMAMNALYVSSSLSYRVKTLRNCLILRKLRSTTFRPLYNSLSYAYGSFRLLFGRTTGRIPHISAFARQASGIFLTDKQRTPREREKTELGMERNPCMSLLWSGSRCNPLNLLRRGSDNLPIRSPYNAGQFDVFDAHTARFDKLAIQGKVRLN